MSMTNGRLRITRYERLNIAPVPAIDLAAIALVAGLVIQPL
jgi:hypothetical protein